MNAKPGLSADFWQALALSLIFVIPFWVGLILLVSWLVKVLL